MHKSEWRITWLRVVRELRGLSQEELAQAAGLSKIAVSRLENAQRSPRFTTARKLAQALDVEPHVIFPDEDQPSPADVLAEYLGLAD